MAIWGGMVVGVDGLHNSIPDEREEAIEVTASKKLRTSPRHQITISRRSADIVESPSTMNHNAERRRETHESPYAHKGNALQEVPIVLKEDLRLSCKKAQTA